MTLSESRGCVYVVATPIGNLEDVSARAARVLGEVSLIACEDTRHTAKLCAHLGLKTPRVSLHAHNEARRLPSLLGRLEKGEDIALVSDAGTPLVSDPGARLVAAALEAGIRVVPIPGPSAVLAALVASGFATRPFMFAGFLPRKGRERANWLRRLAEFPGTLVVFEAPGRVAATFSNLGDVLGPRRVVIARELTKRFEELVRGRLGELDPGELRGEVTLVIEGPSAEASGGSDERVDADALIELLLAEGASVRDIAREVAETAGISRKDAYARLLARQQRG